MTSDAFRFRNAEAVALARIPRLSEAAFRNWIVDETKSGARIAGLFAARFDETENRLVAVLAHDRLGILSTATTPVGARYPALTPEVPQAHWFERALAEECPGIEPEGHPWMKPVRFTRPAPGAGPAVTEYFRVEGEEIHEVAVGPVHAGVIEPGHFRFQCHGETVHHLEISLGFQHRGVERALAGGPDLRTIHYIETAAGDTSIGHAVAHAQAVEALAGCKVPPRAEVIRGVALELERLANHTGDLGALAGDIGFLPTTSYCGRLRGDFLNATAKICGSRFGRGLIRAGRVGFDVDPARAAEIDRALETALADVKVATALLWNTSSVRARFEGTSALSRESCEELGIVGPPARAAGLGRDVRQDHPTGIYRFVAMPISTSHTGDVFGRAYVRWLEIERSTAFARGLLKSMPAGEIRAPLATLAPESFVASLVEGWRGEICHVVWTNPSGRFAAYKVFDPSFHNWFGLAYAMRGQQISDFPLTNKSFNLSYAGHDL